MKKTDGNIIMITAGGTGQRFGADIPKQYMLLCGKPVIEFVIDSCKKCLSADSILVVADPLYHDELRSKYSVDVVNSGTNLNESKRNGLDYIKENSSCNKLLILDAVRPLVSTEVLEKFFNFLDEYDAVACARRITDSLASKNEWKINREDYFTLNAPEGFKFNLIYKHFDASSYLTESIQQLPETSNVYYDFDVPYFEKITYPDDIERIANQMIK